MKRRVGSAFACGTSVPKVMARIGRTSKGLNNVPVVVDGWTWFFIGVFVFINVFGLFRYSRMRASRSLAGCPAERGSGGALGRRLNNLARPDVAAPART